MPMRRLAAEVGGRGIQNCGVTDHLHTAYNLPDILAGRRAFMASCPSPRFHFGVEVSCVSQWEIDEIAAGKHEAPACGLRPGAPPDSPTTIALTAEDIETFGIEYVIGASHWPLHAPPEPQAQIREQQSQNVFLACHPLVDIVGHPWYWSGFWQADGCAAAIPWFGRFHRLPRSMHQEFAAAAVENGTAVEINLRSIVLRDFDLPEYVRHYLQYLAYLQSQGVQLCLGPDCHSLHYDIDLERACAMIERAGIREGWWGLPPRTDMSKPGALLDHMNRPCGHARWRSAWRAEGNCWLPGISRLTTASPGRL